MYFDSHVHSAASPDSEMCAEQAVAAMRAKGLGIAFTEHVDFSEENPNKDPKATDAIRGLGDFVCDFEKYPQGYAGLRGAGVTLGLEFGLTAAFAQANATLAAGDYDFIIGSVHSVDGIELYKAGTKRGVIGDEYVNEPYAAGLHSPSKVDECIARYFAYAREMVEICGFFDAFGHIDYIARYGRLVAENFSYEKFAQEIDALLKSLAEREIALEINTGRFGRGYGVSPGNTYTVAPEPELSPADLQKPVKIIRKICRRFAELGGRFCTIGSDAHDIASLGRGFAEAKEIASDAGLAVVYFKERKPVTCG